MCEFCGSGPTCIVCGRGITELHNRFGCTSVRMQAPDKRVFRVCLRGIYRTIGEVADAIALGAQFKAKFIKLIG